MVSVRHLELLKFSLPGRLARLVLRPRQKYLVIKPFFDLFLLLILSIGKPSITKISAINRALEFCNEMRYINLRFTYLLTYLLTTFKCNNVRGQTDRNRIEKKDKREEEV